MSLARGCLAERVARVQQAGMAVLHAWLTQDFQGNLAALLALLSGLDYGEPLVRGTAMDLPPLLVQLAAVSHA